MSKKYQISFKGLTCFISVFVLTLLIFTPVAVNRSYAASETSVTVGGTIEAEIVNSKRKYDDPAKSKENDSDITLSTLELGIDADLSSAVHGHALLLWEEDENDEGLEDFLNVDEAVLDISNPDKCPYYFRIGKMYLPFGSFDSSFIVDPLTCELGEINQTALQVGYKKGTAEMSFGLYNSDIDENGGEKDKINSYFANIGMDYTDGPYRLVIGLSYLSNILDTDGMEGIAGTGSFDDLPQGMGAFLRADTETAFLIVEYLSAVDNFKLSGLTLKPKTYNFEFGWSSPIDAVLALKLEISDDMQIDADEFNFPTKRYGVVLTYPVFKYATLGLEYLHEKYKWIDSGKNEVITAQLSISF